MAHEDLNIHPKGRGDFSGCNTTDRIARVGEGRENGGRRLRPRGGADSQGPRFRPKTLGFNEQGEPTELVFD